MKNRVSQSTGVVVVHIWPL